ncbi:MAG: cation transporter, partial [Pseudomonadales bacterium]
MKTINTETPTHQEVLSIEGMSCASCVGRIEKQLKKIEHVENAEVNLATEQATIYASQPLDVTQLNTAVERAGYKVTPIEPIELSIEGMSCASCVGRVEKSLKK